MAQRQEKIQTVKYAPPPPGIPVHGFVPPEEVCFLGRANYEGALQAKNFIFGIYRKDRARHMYVVGKSGSGKSKFLELLLRQDIAYGHGLCLIDPSGEMAEGLLDFIPEERRDDTVFVNLRDGDYPVSVNPFFGMSEPHKHQYVEFLIEVFRGYCGASWTPEAEYVSRFVFLSLLDYHNASFFGILLMLTNPSYRTEVLKEVKDQVVRNFWEREFLEKQNMFEERVTLPWKTRFGHFFFDPSARLMFSQERPSIDFEEAIRKRQIVLVSLPKGTMPDDAVGFLGSLFLSLFRISGLKLREKEKNEKSFYLYLDEFQNLQLEPFVHLFAECAKSGIAVTLAHRYIGQLPEHIRTAIFGNVGSVVVFRVSGEDALRLRPEMAPVFDAKDMINLGTQEFYVKTTVRGEVCDPFSGEVLRVFPAGGVSQKEHIVERSRKLVALPRAEAEEMASRELKAYSGA